MPRAHEAECALALMQPTKTGAQVTLDAGIVKLVPVAGRMLIEEFCHCAPSIGAPPLLCIELRAKSLRCGVWNIVSSHSARASSKRNM